MKRFHVHVAVADLDQSIRFYSQLFASEPTVVKPDYAKWMLDDPRVNFAISNRGTATGLNHLGLQVDSDQELDEVHGRLEQAEGTILAEEGVSCCYAKSDKYWITDPQGIAWETFHSLGSVPFFGEEHTEEPAAESTCCMPDTSKGATSSSEAAPKGCCAPTAAAVEGRSCC